MSEVIETTVYRLDELSDAAREKARAWYREGGFDDDWYDSVYEDFQRIGEILGLRLKTRAVRLHGGGARQEPRIWFRGFWSQGDGACVETFYSYRKHAPRRIRDYAPQDTELHRIADVLQAIHAETSSSFTPRPAIAATTITNTAWRSPLSAIVPPIRI